MVVLAHWQQNPHKAEKGVCREEVHENSRGRVTNSQWHQHDVGCPTRSQSHHGGSFLVHPRTVRVNQTIETKGGQCGAKLCNRFR